jgi:DNA-binding NarL/FixJ family response regulator
LTLIQSDEPDIAVFDLDLSGMSALEILRRLREAQIQTRMVILPSRNERKSVLEALRRGANALVQIYNMFTSGKPMLPTILSILRSRERQERLCSASRGEPCGPR